MTVGGWSFIIIGGILLVVGAFIQGRHIRKVRQRAAKRASKGNPISPFNQAKKQMKSAWQLGWNAGLANAQSRRERRMMK